MKLVVLGPNEKISDLPEYKNLATHNVDHTACILEYSSEAKLLVVDLENVLGNLCKDPYTTECQVIRVFAKALYHVTGKRPVEANWGNRGRNAQGPRLAGTQQYELRVQRMDIRFDRNLKKLYNSAMSKGRWKGTVAVHDRVEYWTEGVLAYFNVVGQGVPPNDAAAPITTREALKDYDPDLFALVDETMAYHGKVDWRYQPLTTQCRQTGRFDNFNKAAGKLEGPYVGERYIRFGKGTVGRIDH